MSVNGCLYYCYHKTLLLYTALLFREAVAVGIFNLFNKAAPLNSFTSETISIRVPPVSVNGTIGQEIAGILRKYWIKRADNWTELESRIDGLHDISSRAGLLSFLLSFFLIVCVLTRML